MKISKDLEIAIKASLVAGKKIIEIYNSDDFDVSKKSDSSPLTIADKESHKIIVDFLSKTGYPILSEEGSEIDYKKRKAHFIIKNDFTKKSVKIGVNKILNQIA